MANSFAQRTTFPYNHGKLFVDTPGDGTFTVPAYVGVLHVAIAGAGGAGANKESSCAYGNTSGGGGGGGAVLIFDVYVDELEEIKFHVGAGGVPNTSNGEDTTFMYDEDNDRWMYTAGGGGSAGVASATYDTGGPGGTATGVGIKYDGNDGGDSIAGGEVNTCPQGGIGGKPSCFLGEQLGTAPELYAYILGQLIISGNNYLDGYHGTGGFGSGYDANGNYYNAGKGGDGWLLIVW